MIGATNSPWLLDDAVRKIFEDRIYLPLPEHSERLAMFKLCMAGIPTSITEADYNDLASKTGGYSGSDIDIVVRDALMQPLRKDISAKRLAKVTLL